MIHKEYPEDEILKGIMKMIKEDKDLFDFLLLYNGDDDTQAQKENK